MAIAAVCVKSMLPKRMPCGFSFEFIGNPAVALFHCHIIAILRWADATDVRLQVMDIVGESIGAIG